MPANAFWESIGMWSHLGSAIVCACVAAWVIRGGIGPLDRKAAFGALVGTAIWALLAAINSPFSVWALLGETVRNLGWLFLLYSLFRRSGRDVLLAVRPFLIVLALVESCQPVLLIIQLQLPEGGKVTPVVFQTAVVLHLLIAIGVLLLAHNLHIFANAIQASALRWAAAAVTVVGVVELNFYTVAFLTRGVPIELAAIRGGVIACAILPLAISLGRTTRSLGFYPSRVITFRTLSLVIIGLYLVTMVVIARMLVWFGGDYARLTQVAFLFIASVLALLWLPSERLRRWVKVVALKHLFQHRYDYRVEWLNLTRTIRRDGPEVLPLHQRVVQALANITESPGGLLLVPDGHHSMVLASRWEWQGADIPSLAMEGATGALRGAGNYIWDLDDIRQNGTGKRPSGEIPDWILADDHAWAIVPLQHFERLIGLVILARPLSERTLDWEDFDLLRVAGQQLASYMAEHAGQEALDEASRFEEFNRRMAFVMHDIKNLSSQLSLLVRNAERHIEKPEFRSDMLVTLRNSSDKLNALLERLGRYGAQSGEKVETVALERCVERVVAQYALSYPVVLAESEPCEVAARRDGLEQAIVHLVQNAIDASPERTPIYLRVVSEGGLGIVEIVDSGTGMSAEFMRSRLFKPFVSSKRDGFGIGAFEARELVLAMGGQLDVESREGLGTRFFVRLPKAGMRDFLETTKSGESEVA